MTEAWRLEGEYLENCNCEFLCPCLLGPRTERGGPVARPTEGHCDVPLVFHVESGRYGDTALDGLNAALVVYTPGPMGEGDWTMGVYVDSAGTPAQQEALEAVFGGTAGGVMGHVWGLAATRLPTRAAEIHFRVEARRRWAEIPGLLDIAVEGIEGREGPETESWLDNVRHFVAGRIATAKATKGTFRDHGFEWDNAGRNAHYAHFEWSGP